MYGTDALNQDTDGDGILDGQEHLDGLNPVSADTDRDWFSDSYEQGELTDPADTNDAPNLLISLNDNAYLSASAIVTLQLPGVVADNVRIVEDSVPPITSVVEYAESIPYIFVDESNGTRAVYTTLMRGAGEESYRHAGTIVLDTLPPSLSVTAPTSNLVVSSRWVQVTGLAGDAGSFSVTINGNHAHGVVDGQFRYDQLELVDGTNLIVVAAEDGAGHTVTQIVPVLQNLSLDVTAPSVELDLPSEVGTVSSGLYMLEVGSNDTTYLQGIVDDEAAWVSLEISQDGATNGPYEAMVDGTQFWGNVSLFAGTNDLLVTGQDAAGNLTTTNYLILRDSNTFVQVTNLAPYEVVNAESTTVSGVVSLDMVGGTVTVNGVEATLTPDTGHAKFTATISTPQRQGLERIRRESQTGNRRNGPFCGSTAGLV